MDIELKAGNPDIFVEVSIKKKSHKNSLPEIALKKSHRCKQTYHLSETWYESLNTTFI